MSSNLNSIKTRLGAIKSTKKITNAMKLVASSKEKSLQKRLLEVKNYYKHLETSFNNAVFINKANNEADVYSSPLFYKNKDVYKNLIIIITSNSGLCASYNQNIIRYLSTIYHKNDEILIIGEKGRLELEKQGINNTNLDFLYLGKEMSIYPIEELVDFIIDEYKNKKYRYVRLVYTRYINSLISKPIDINLLPLEINENKNRSYSPIYEPSKEEVIDTLSEELLLSRLNIALIESMLCEESTRRNAMDNATKNADDLIDGLTLEYNKARQASITNEITEVVSGSKLIKK